MRVVLPNQKRGKKYDAMISKRRGFIIQRDNELRDLEAQMLNLVCHDVEIEPVLQEITSESLAGGG